MKPYFVIKIILLLLLPLLLLFTLYSLSKSRTFQFFGSLTSRVETTQKNIALTFDDSPTQETL